MVGLLKFVEKEWTSVNIFLTVNMLISGRPHTCIF